LLKLQKIEN